MKRSKYLWNATYPCLGWLSHSQEVPLSPTIYREGPLSIWCQTCLDGFSQIRGIPSLLGQGSWGLYPQLCSSGVSSYLANTAKRPNTSGRTLTNNYSCQSLLKRFPHALPQLSGLVVFCSFGHNDFALVLILRYCFVSKGSLISSYLFEFRCFPRKTWLGKG